MLRERFRRKFNVYLLVFFFFLLTAAVHYFLSIKCSPSKDEGVKSKLWFRLVVIILSDPNNLERRDTIRQTWLSSKRSEVKHIFSIGTVGLLSDQMLTLQSEASKYDDLLLLPKLQDSYGTITKKVLQSFSFVSDNYDFDFVLKCDDDSFVSIDQLIKELNGWQNKASKRELYWGFFNGRAQVKRSGPWKEMDWILCDYYLPYALGGGYILSRNLIKYIAINEDVLK